MNSFEACLKAVKRNDIPKGFIVKVVPNENKIIVENDMLIETITFSYHVKTEDEKRASQIKSEAQFKEKYGVSLN